MKLAPYVAVLCCTMQGRTLVMDRKASCPAVSHTCILMRCLGSASAQATMCLGYSNYKLVVRFLLSGVPHCGICKLTATYTDLHSCRPQPSNTINASWRQTKSLGSLTTWLKCVHCHVEKHCNKSSLHLMYTESPHRIIHSVQLLVGKCRGFQHNYHCDCIFTSEVQRV